METPNSDTVTTALPVETTTETTTETTEKSVPLLHQIRTAVKTALATTAGTEVRAAMEAKLIKEGIDKRAEAFAKVVVLVEGYEKTISGIKPFFAGVGLDKKPVGGPMYKPEDAKLHEETTQKLGKAHAALDLAISSHDFTKVMELAQKG